MADTDLRGVYPVVSTPFQADGTVDHDGIERILEAQIDRGIQGVVLFGIAAEFYKLGDDERRRILETAAETLAGTPTDLVVSVTDHSTARAERFASFAETTGADALMVLPPYFLGPSTDDLQRHLRRVGDVVEVPVMVQYAPEQTGVTIDPQTFVDLRDAVETLRYVKVESRPPGPDISAIVEPAGGRVDVLVGYGGLHLLEALDRGAVGVIPGAALSEYYREIWDRYQAGERAAARDRHAELLPLLTHLLQDIEGFIHYEKRMLAAQGLIDAPRTREPAFQPDEHFDRRFEECFRAVADDPGDAGS